MVNDVMRDSIEWAFSIFSQIWPIVVFPFILSLTVQCFKILCGISCRRSGVKKSVTVSDPVPDPVPDSVPDPVSDSVPDPVPASDRLFICSCCDDCPMLLKGDNCRLSGTAFCSIGKWVSKGGKLI